jgi:hypothetical protein
MARINVGSGKTIGSLFFAVLLNITLSSSISSSVSGAMGGNANIGSLCGIGFVMG